jgi:gamma-glutamyltranspeptidase/glutathione hydrolase
MFALYYSAETKRVTALNGSGRAPAALTLDRLKQEGLSTLTPFHVHTVTVPGACQGWFDLIAKHGSLAMSEILTPAIRLADEGFPVAPITAYSWQRGAQKQLSTGLNGHEMTINGRGPNAGEIFRNPNLARTFKTIAEHGPCN